MSAELVQTVIGYASAVLILAACITYLRATLQGRVQSNRVTWGVWTILTGLICASYYEAVGDAGSVWTSFAYFVGTAVIFVSLLVYAGHGTWTWVEKICLLAVFPIVVLWIVSESAVLTLTLLLCIDVLGSIPLLVAVYRDPAIEYGFGWLLACFGNTLNLFAVERWDYANAAYPVYFVLLTLTLTILIYAPMFYGVKSDNSGGAHDTKIS